MARKLGNSFHYDGGSLAKFREMVEALDQNVAKVLRLNRGEYFVSIMLPAAAPFIFTGLRIGVIGYLRTSARFFRWNSWILGSKALHVRFNFGRRAVGKQVRADAAEV